MCAEREAGVVGLQDSEEPRQQLKAQEDSPTHTALPALRGRADTACPLGAHSRAQVIHPGKSLLGVLGHRGEAA